MKSLEDHHSLEEQMLTLQKRAKKGPTSIKEVFSILSGKGQVLLLILLSLPFCQPIQIPGFSTPFGLAITFIGLRMAFGKKTWLPKKLLNYEIGSETLLKVCSSTLWAVKKARKWIHPRLEWMHSHYIIKISNGLLIAFLGIFLALPLPIPFSNLVAAWAIFLISMGLLEDDGLFILLGYILALASLALMLFVIFELIPVIAHKAYEVQKAALR